MMQQQETHDFPWSGHPPPLEGATPASRGAVQPHLAQADVLGGGGLTMLLIGGTLGVLGYLAWQQQKRR